MPYSPEDIVAYEFRPKTRGYDRDEVDGFLDALADQIEEAATEQEALRAQVAALEARLTEAQESESALKRAFITVQEASDRVLAEAQEEVAQLREEVATELDGLREQASREAAATKREAEAEARELVETAERAAAEQRERIGELQRLDAEHRQRLQSSLEEQLAALRALPDPFATLAPDVPPPPAPQPWDHGAGDQHQATGPEPDDPGPAGGPVTEGDHAAGLEEVADLWRLQEDVGHDVAAGSEGEVGDDTPAADAAARSEDEAGDDTPAGDDAPADDTWGEHIERPVSPSDEH